MSNNIDNFYFNFNNIDEVGLSSYLLSIDWHYCLCADELNDVVNKFNEILIYSLEQFVEIRERKYNRHPPWFDKNLTNLKNRQDKAYKNFKNSNCILDKQIFLNRKLEFDTCHRVAHHNYITKVQYKIKLTPKSFWKYVNSKRKIGELPSSMALGDQNASSAKDISNLFADFFQSTYSYKTSNNIEVVQLSSNSIHIPYFSRDDIANALASFKDGCGPDGIPSLILKKFSKELSLPLSIIFEQSLSKGEFPALWKISHVTPIYKTGPRSKIDNYRGVAILCAMPKLLESMVCEHISFRIKNLISEFQHGFIKGRSTATNLMVFSKKVLDVIESGFQMDVIYTDFSKAFDVVDHSLLLRKLAAFGFSPLLLKWSSTYLMNRKQYVLINGVKSNIIDVHSGVPQGSHLGPLYFILFINDIGKIIRHSEYLAYADDMKIFKCIKTHEDTQQLQSDIDSIYGWCAENGLALNIKKCKFMTYSRSKNSIVAEYTINGDLLDRVYAIKDLGVFFTSNFCFTRHIEFIVHKALGMLGFLKRVTKEFTDPFAVITLYTSLVRSQLEYCAVIWNPSYDKYIERLENIQKQFLIYFAFKFQCHYDSEKLYWENVRDLPPYLSRCKDLNLETLNKRREIAGATLVSDLLLGKIDCPLLLGCLNMVIPSKQLRQTRFLSLEFHKTNYGNNSAINSILKSFNVNYNYFDFNMTRSKFKKGLKLN